MRAVVALVEARPETIIEDYRRVMDLAGLAGSVDGRPVALVPQARSGGWFPGAGSPPWQLDGVLAWLEGKREKAAGGAGSPVATVVLPVSLDGGSGPERGWAWQDVLARHGIETASEHFRDLRPFRAEPALPALEGALAGGLTLPTGLRDRAILLLPVPALDPDRSVTGGMALLRALLAPGLGRGRGESAAEITADVVRFARQALPGLGVVMDAVLWQIGRRAHVRLPVQRNILLAGSDPVAVDAVAARLAGRDPERDPWLRLCRDRELGAVRTGDIRLVGRQDLMDPGFEVPDRAIPRPLMDWDRLPLSDFFRRRFKRPALLKNFARTPWGGLADAYRTGRQTGDAG